MRRIAAAACFTLAVVCLLPAAAQADQPVEVGWWYKLTAMPPSESAAPAGPAAPGGSDAPASPAPAPTLPPPPVPIPTVPTPTSLPEPPVNVPPPAAVPDGGLYVANDPSGPAAVSALRFDGTDVGEATLTLPLAPGSTTTTPFTIVACPPLSAWTAVQNGAWRDRPAHDCARAAISGVLAADGASMTWNIPATFKPVGASTLDVLLLPIEGEGQPFSVVFQAPGSDSLAVLGPPPPTTAYTPTTLPPLPSNLPGSSPSYSAPSSGSTGATPAAAVPSAPTVAATPGAAAAAPAETPATGVLAAFKENRVARIVSAVLLVLMGVAFYVASDREARLPRLLGAVAASRANASVAAERVARARGIGRFKRPRFAPAIRL